MNERDSGVNPHQEPETLNGEEFSSASDVMLALVRSAKALRMYLPNNPVLMKFTEELNFKMMGHLVRFGDFRLDVETFALKYAGAEVYANQDPKESLAFRIYSDGIRVLQFAAGLEARELTEFLGIVGFEPPNGQDDDIVTQLWEKNLPHITYLLEEDFAEVDAQDQGSAQTFQQDAISRIYDSLADKPPIPQQVLPMHLLTLTREEVESLKKARQAEAHRDPLNDVVYILSAVLSAVKDPELFCDFLDIMAKLTVNRFLAGEVTQVLGLVRFLDKLARFGNIQPGQRLQVGRALTGILTEQTAQVLQERLDADESVSPEQLKEFLQTFGPSSLETICGMLGGVKKLKLRKVIIGVLVELGRGRPELFGRFLADPRWFLVRNMVLILSLLNAPEALDMVVGLISHREMRVRKEVLAFLERSPAPKAKPYLVKFLRDEYGPLRIKALQILAREKFPFALKPVLALAAADDFRARELAERKAVYEAIGELGGEGMVPLFRDLLLKKRWFTRSAGKEDAICAVAGLVKMNNRAALELLQEARQLRNAELRGIVDQGISALAARREQASVGGEV